MSTATKKKEEPLAPDIDDMREELAYYFEQAANVAKDWVAGFECLANFTRELPVDDPVFQTLANDPGIISGEWKPPRPTSLSVVELYGPDGITFVVNAQAATIVALSQDVRSEEHCRWYLDHWFDQVAASYIPGDE